jgi:hypothetical protein
MSFSEDPKEIIDIQKKLEAERDTTEQHWQEVSELMLTRQDDFFHNRDRTPGEKRQQKVFDSVAPLALEKFAAAMESILTPRTERWHMLEADIPELNEIHEVREYHEHVTDILFRLRYSTTANFASQNHETYMSLGAFGTGVMLLNDLPGVGFRYKSSHISEHYFMENHHGRIDVDYRMYKETAINAVNKWGEDRLPDTIVRCATKEPYKKFDFIHAVFPNDRHIEGSLNPDNYKFRSIHLSVEGGKILSKGGFRTFPFIISRYVTSPNEIYGRSPGMTALAETKMVNNMRKSDLRARHKAIDPPILTASEQSIRKLNMRPNAMNYGTLDDNGNPLVKPFQNGARVDVSNDAIQQSHEIINDIFLVKLFQILVDTPQMTATEVLQRTQEKGALLAPTAGRQQNEAQGPMIEREIDLANFAGLLPPMPDVLREAGGEYSVRYTSPLTKMQKTEKALSASRTLESVIPLIELDPGIMDNFDLDEFVAIQHDANAAPMSLLRSPEERDALRQARAEQQQMQQMMEQAPGVAGAIKDVAQAQSFGESNERQHRGPEVYP